MPPQDEPEEYLIRGEYLFDDPRDGFTGPGWYILFPEWVYGPRKTADNLREDMIAALTRFRDRIVGN